MSSRRNLRSFSPFLCEIETFERKRLLTTFATDFSQLEPTDYTHTEILVRFRDGVDVAELATSVSAAPFDVSQTIMSGPLG